MLLADTQSLTSLLCSIGANLFLPELRCPRLLESSKYVGGSRGLLGPVLLIVHEIEPSKPSRIHLGNDQH